MIHEEIDPDKIIELAEDQKWDVIAMEFKDRHPADLADLLQQTDKALRNELFIQIAEDLKPGVLAHLEGDAEDEVLEGLTVAEISDLVEDMSPDDAADVIAELSKERSAKVLDLMEQEESDEVRELLKYDEESAGGLMTPDVVALPADMTVAGAMDHIAESDLDEPFFYAYVVDDEEKLTGLIGLWDLVRIKDKLQTLGEISRDNVVSVNTGMDQEEVAKLMSKYDLTSLPVVNGTGTLVGRITIDDMVDVMEDEASEDIFMLAGSDDAELTHNSAIQAVKSRIPWLLITLAAGFVASLVLRDFMETIEQVLLLTVFVPIVMAMGGSTGVQSSTLIVRSLALGHIDSDDWMKVIGREVIAAVIMGFVCAVVMGIWVMGITLFGGPEENGFPPLFLSLTVGIALFCAMLFAAVYGAFIPIVLDKYRVDPAVASGPFVTASNDIAALLIYYAVTLGMISAYTPS